MFWIRYTKKHFKDMNDKLKQFLQWTVELFGRSPVSAVILWLCMAAVFVAMLFCFGSCHPFVLVQKDNSGSSISVPTTTTVDVDSVDFRLPINNSLNTKDNE